MEKKVMVRLCAKIVAETDLYETDKEVQNLIDWVCCYSLVYLNQNPQFFSKLNKVWDILI